LLDAQKKDDLIWFVCFDRRFDEAVRYYELGLSITPKAVTSSL
jgi:hypothetical protein